MGQTPRHWVGLRIGCSSQIGLGFVYPVRRNGLAISFLGRYAFTRLPSCGLRFPVHPFLMEMLDRFGIALGQLMPNSWRIVVSYMGIRLATTDRDMIKVDELVYLYRLKESKEHGYYELVPWERRTRIIRGLPSSFRYWKSRFFLYPGTTLRPSPIRFRVISQGCSVSGESYNQVRHYFFSSIDFFCVHFIVTNSFAPCFVQLRDGPNLKAGTGSTLIRQLNT